MKKNVLIWSIPRAGTTAYSSYLKMCGICDNDELQDVLTSWLRVEPKFYNDNIDPLIHGYPVDSSIVTDEFIIKAKDNHDWKWCIDKLKNKNEKWIFEKLMPDPITKKPVRMFVKNVPTVFEMDNLNHTYANYICDYYGNNNETFSIKVFSNTELPENVIAQLEQRCNVEHHLFLRKNIIDHTIGDLLVRKTGVWHEIEIGNWKKKIKDITIDFADEHTQHVLRCMKREYERMYDLFKNKKHKLVYYEDLDLSNLKWKKLWTWEEKKSICKNMHIAEEIIG